ncbi:hypothetical protein N752_18465 [Desulforamulus aquiferis]|nr:hypothetical protein N752_18465 [Desulforamulus aquiferis]
MFTLKDLAQPGTLDEAYQILVADRSNVLLGGCAYLRLGSLKINTAIDLSKINLDI